PVPSLTPTRWSTSGSVSATCHSAASSRSSRSRLSVPTPRAVRSTDHLTDHTTIAEGRSRDAGAKPRWRKGRSAMTMTDPIADMLTRLRNANTACHDSVAMPYSKLKAGVAEILQQEGYITSYDVKESTDDEGAPAIGKTLTIVLKYGRNRERSIA